MGTLQDPPQLFQYLDYRIFLNDYFSFRKTSERGFSMRAFGRLPELALSSSTFLSAVIKGRKNLSQGLRLRFGRAMELKPAEMEYFELLVQFNQSKTADEKNHYLAQLSKYHGSRARKLPESQYKFYSRWYYSVIWNYIGLHPTRANPALIGKNIFPALSAQQVDEAIKVLLELRLIKKMANGYAVTDRHLGMGKAFRGQVARQHNREFIHLGLDALERVPAEARQFNVMSFSVSPRGLDCIREKMDSFRAELREIVESDQGEDCVYAMAMQLFPCSRAPGEN